MLTEEQKQAIKREFELYVNMDENEMLEHFASSDSDFVSLDPRIALKIGKQSGKTGGKSALALKRKKVWEDDDFSQAKSLVTPIKRNLGRKVSYSKDDGTPTPFTVMMRNRGHDPLKTVGDTATVTVAESTMTTGKLQTLLQESVNAYFDSVLGGMPYEMEKPWVNYDKIYPYDMYFIMTWDGDDYRITFSFTENGDISLGEMEEVEIVYAPKELSVASEEGSEYDSQLISVQESAGNKPFAWKGVMVRAGYAINIDDENGQRRYYPPDVLKKAVAEGVFDYVVGFNRTDEKHGKEAVAPEAGLWQKAEWDSNVPPMGGVVNTLHWKNEAYPSAFHGLITKAIQEGKTDGLPGFSLTGDVIVDKKKPNVVRGFVGKIRSCDPISFPSAGGTIISVSESMKHPTLITNKEVVETMKKNQKEVKAILDQNLSTEETITKIKSVTEGALQDFAIGYLKETSPQLFEGEDAVDQTLLKNESLLVKLLKLAMGVTTPTESADDSGEAEMAKAVAEAVRKEISKLVPPKNNDDDDDKEAIKVVRESAMTMLIEGSKLNEVEKKSLLENFRKRDSTYTIKEVRESVQSALDRQTAYEKAGMLKDAGVSVIKDSTDKAQEQVYDFFFQDVPNHQRKSVQEAIGDVKISNRQPRALSVKALYGLLTGDHDLTFDPTTKSVREAMDATVATTLLTNGMNARLAYEYENTSEYDGFREIVNIVPVYDYQTKKALAYGGFSGWNSVAKGSEFNALTDDGATEESYTALRYGGIVTVNEVDIVNDNVGYVQSIPRRLALEAKRRLSAFVWTLVISNPTLADDSVVVFHSSHNNVMSDVLSSTSLRAAIGKLQAQTHPNSTDKLMTRPKYLIIGQDPEQQELAYKLTTVAADQSNNVPAWAQGLGIMPLINPHTDDTNDFYLFGDKNQIGIIELGILNGQETPELSTSQAEGVGTWFTHGDARWKVKQAYSGTWVTYKGAVRSAVA